MRPGNSQERLRTGKAGCSSQGLWRQERGEDPDRQSFRPGTAQFGQCTFNPSQVLTSTGKAKLKRSVSIIFVSLMFAMGVKDLNAQRVTSLAPCRMGQRAPATGFWTWAPNAQV